MKILENNFNINLTIPVNYKLIKRNGLICLFEISTINKVSANWFQVFRIKSMFIQSKFEYGEGINICNKKDQLLYSFNNLVNATECFNKECLCWNPAGARGIEKAIISTPDGIEYRYNPRN